MNRQRPAFIEPHPDAGTDAHVQNVYQRQAKAFGYLPNYAPLFSHRPEVINKWAALQRELRCNVSNRLFELVTFAAAMALKSSYCSLAHGSTLRAELSDAEIVELARGHYEQVVTPAEAAAMRYGAQVARDANAVEARQIDALRDTGWSDSEIFDIAGIAAGRAFFSKLTEGLGARPDAAYRDLPQQLRCALTPGRAIMSCSASAHDRQSPVHHSSASAPAISSGGGESDGVSSPRS